MVGDEPRPRWRRWRLVLGALGGVAVAGAAVAATVAATRSEARAPAGPQLVGAQPGGSETEPLDVVELATLRDGALGEAGLEGKWSWAVLGMYGEDALLVQTRNMTGRDRFGDKCRSHLHRCELDTASKVVTHCTDALFTTAYESYCETRPDVRFTLTPSGKFVVANRDGFNFKALAIRPEGIQLVSQSRVPQMPKPAPAVVSDTCACRTVLSSSDAKASVLQCSAFNQTSERFGATASFPLRADLNVGSDARIAVAHNSVYVWSGAVVVHFEARFLNGPGSALVLGRQLPGFIDNVRATVTTDGDVLVYIRAGSVWNVYDRELGTNLASVDAPGDSTRIVGQDLLVFRASSVTHWRLQASGSANATLSFLQVEKRDNAVFGRVDQGVLMVLPSGIGVIAGLGPRYRVFRFAPGSNRFLEEVSDALLPLPLRTSKVVFAGDVALAGTHGGGQVVVLQADASGGLTEVGRSQPPAGVERWDAIDSSHFSGSSTNREVAVFHTRVALAFVKVQQGGRLAELAGPGSAPLPSLVYGTTCSLGGNSFVCTSDDVSNLWTRALSGGFYNQTQFDVTEPTRGYSTALWAGDSSDTVWTVRIRPEDEPWVEACVLGGTPDLPLRWCAKHQTRPSESANDAYTSVAMDSKTMVTAFGGRLIAFQFTGAAVQVSDEIDAGGGRISNLARAPAWDTTEREVMISSVGGAGLELRFVRVDRSGKFLPGIVAPAAAFEDCDSATWIGDIAVLTCGRGLVSVGISGSRMPTAFPSKSPTASPSASPTLAPTRSPSTTPTHSPSATPSTGPTANPVTPGPTASPNLAPSASPSAAPTTSPSVAPSAPSSAAPSTSPSVAPSSSAASPSSSSPSTAPSSPAASPSSSSPSTAPSSFTTTSPSSSPSTASPTSVASQSTSIVAGLAATGALAIAAGLFVLFRRRRGAHAGVSLDAAHVKAVSTYSDNPQHQPSV